MEFGREIGLICEPVLLFPFKLMKQELPMAMLNLSKYDPLEKQSDPKTNV
jgi:hypothetical protein